MEKVISIFDFDRTITKMHTFQKYRIENYHGAHLSDSYSDGLMDAETNTKRDMKTHLRHDEHEITAVATYHNNPSFIAGYISFILGKN